MSDREQQEVGGRAVVSLTVEVNVGTWGTDCRLDQVYKQAAESAVQTLHRALNPKGEAEIGRIVGVPKVEAVIAPRPR